MTDRPSRRAARTAPRRLAQALAGFLAGVLVAGVSPAARAQGLAEARAGTLDRVAAVVNDDVIALSEVYDFVGDAMEEECLPPAVDACRRQILGDALDTLVRRALQRQELVRLKSDVTEEEIDHTIQQVVLEYGLADRDALRAEVEDQGMPWDLYRRYQIEDYVREQKFNQLVLRGRVTITEDELRDQYQRLVREHATVDVVRLDGFGTTLPEDPDGRLAAVTELATALEEVRQGTRTFEDVAAAFDDRKVTGFVDQAFAREDLPENLADVAFETPEGGVAQPVVANGVLWAIRVGARDIGTADVAPFEEVKDRLGDQVFVAKLKEASDVWYAGARRRAALKVLVDVPGFESTERPSPATAEPEGEGETSGG